MKSKKKTIVIVEMISRQGDLRSTGNISGTFQGPKLNIKVSINMSPSLKRYRGRHISGTTNAISSEKFYF